MSEKRPAEESSSTSVDAPPAKKQRLNSSEPSSIKSIDKPEPVISVDKMEIDSKSPEKTDNNNNNNKESKESKSSDSSKESLKKPVESSEQQTSESTSEAVVEGGEEEDIDIKTNEKRIVFLTGNKGKLSEVQSFFNDEIKSLICNEKLDLEEIQGTPQNIIKHKLLSARKVLQSRGNNSSILVEDTSFVLESYSKINKSSSEENGVSNGDNNNSNNSNSKESNVAMLGMPGPFVKWLLKWDRDGNEGLCKMVRGLGDGNNKANAICIFGFLPKNSDECLFFEGICGGSVPDKPMNGENGFGWDPCFIPNGFDKSFAQMSVEDKNKISHRGIALIKFKEYLEKNYVGNDSTVQSNGNNGSNDEKSK